MAPEKYDFSPRERELLERQVREELQVLNDYVMGAMKVSGSSPLAAFTGWLGRLFGKAAAGPDTYVDPDASPWLRPKNIAGGGCIILGLFLAMALVYAVAYGVKYPVYGGIALAAIVLAIAYHLYVKSERKKGIASLGEELIIPLNRAELARAEKIRNGIAGGAADESATRMRDSARARVHAGFTADVADYAGRHHYFLGEGLWAFDGAGFTKVYLVVRPFDTLPAGDDLTRQRDALFNDFKIMEINNGLGAFSNLPAGIFLLNLTWQLPKKTA